MCLSDFLSLPTHTSPIWFYTYVIIFHMRLSMYTGNLDMYVIQSILFSFVLPSRRIKKVYIYYIFFVRLELLLGLFFVNCNWYPKKFKNKNWYWLKCLSDMKSLPAHCIRVQWDCEVLFTNLSVTDSLILQILSLKWYLLQHVFWMTIRLGTKYFFNLKYITLGILVSTWNRGVYRIYNLH